jgi:anti-sigma regulatory factor (Ser/Thr protein kinase)
MPPTIPYRRSASGKIRRRLTSSDITDLLLSEAFDHSGVTALRHSIASAAATAGLGGDRLDDFVVAVNELLTNAVRHGGGGGRVRLWRQDGAVVCEVRDDGPGLPPGRADHQDRPAPDQPGGWGLWLAGRLTDSFSTVTGDGTTVRISSRIPQ